MHLPDPGLPTSRQGHPCPKSTADFKFFRTTLGLLHASEHQHSWNFKTEGEPGFWNWVTCCCASSGSPVRWRPLLCSKFIVLFHMHCYIPSSGSLELEQGASGPGFILLNVGVFIYSLGVSLRLSSTVEYCKIGYHGPSGCNMTTYFRRAQQNYLVAPTRKLNEATYSKMTVYKISMNTS